MPELLMSDQNWKWPASFPSRIRGVKFQTGTRQVNDTPTRMATAGFVKSDTANAIAML
jgi:hypothetical protein